MTPGILRTQEIPTAWALRPASGIRLGHRKCRQSAPAGRRVCTRLDSVFRPCNTSRRSVDRHTAIPPLRATGGFAYRHRGGIPVLAVDSKNGPPQIAVISGLIPRFLMAWASLRTAWAERGCSSPFTSKPRRFFAARRETGVSVISAICSGHCAVARGRETFHSKTTFPASGLLDLAEMRVRVIAELRPTNAAKTGRFQFSLQRFIVPHPEVR